MARGHQNIKANSGQTSTTLPLDVLFLIMMECDVRSILRCRLVCHQFDDFIMKRRPLLYKIALKYECQVDCQEETRTLPVADSIYASAGEPYPTSLHLALSSSQKLQHLRRQSLAWCGVRSPAMRKLIPVTRNDTIYELNGGIFGLGDVLGTEPVWVPDPVPGYPSPPSSPYTRLDFVRLPSALTGNTEPEWRFVYVPQDTELVDFTMDAQSDLLVLVEQRDLWNPSEETTRYQLNFVSLSLSGLTLVPHPLAHRPKVSYPSHKDCPDYMLVFGMYSSHIGILMNSGRVNPNNYDQIVIWDWVNGGVAAHHATNQKFDSFLFIREGLLLVPANLEGGLDIVSYSLSPADVKRESLSDPVPGSTTKLMRFALPTLRPGLAYLYTLVRGQPHGSSIRYVGSKTEQNPHFGSNITANRHIETPFTSDIDESIFVLSMRVIRIADPTAEMQRPVKDADSALIIKRKTINKWLDRMETMKEMLAERLGITVEQLSYLPAPTFNEYIEAETEKVKPLECSPGPIYTSSNGIEYREQGVQTHDEDEGARILMKLRTVVGWEEWMGETRWIRGMGSPRWVRDIHGTRLACRTVDLPDVDAPIPFHSYPEESEENEIPGLALGLEMFPGTSMAATSVTPADSFAHHLHPPSDDFGVDTNLPMTTIVPSSMVTPPRTTGGFRTCVMDFNVHTHREALFSSDEGNKEDSFLGEPTASTTLSGDEATSSSTGGNGWRRQVISHKTVILAGETYAEDICTGAPYVELTSRWTHECVALMLDSERIIGMKTDEEGNLKSLEVTVI